MESFREDQPGEPWVIDADNLRYDETARIYEGQGNVVIQRGGRVLRADRIRFDQPNHRVEAEGNIRLTAGGDFLTGSRLTMNLLDQTGTLEDGYLFLRENNYHIRGRRIEKVGENAYVIEEASITTCDGEVPDWRIDGKTVKVALEGTGTVRHAVMRVRNKPVLYSPFFVFPANNKRQTGLLVPKFGQSDRWGYFIDQPFFWAINDSADATAYLQYLTERGTKPAGELRYILSSRTKGAWMIDYLHDRKVDDGRGDSSDRWGYTDDDFLRPNRDRYWVRGGHVFPAPGGLRGKLELDIVSDQDYLTEFREGYTGFDETQQYFNEFFSRELDDYSDPFRLNRLDLYRGWTNYTLEVDFRWLQDSTKEPVPGADDITPAVQRLPLVLFSGLKQRLFSTPFYFDLNSNYNYLYQRNQERGQRLDLHPRLYWPFRFRNIVSFQPSLGLRETLYYVDKDAESAMFTSSGDWSNRNLWDGRAEISSEVFRVYSTGLPRVDRIKHSVVPGVVYSFIPRVQQDSLPEFDAVDRIARRNLVTYSINNFFIARSRSASEPAVAETPPASDYRQFARFNLEQSYFIKSPKGRDLALWPRGTEKHPFSPIGAELDFYFNPYLSLESDAQWNLYDSRFDSANLALELGDTRGDKLKTEYRYTRREVESIKSDLLLQLTQPLGIGFEYEYNLRESQRLQSGVRLIYKAGCWAARVRYLNQPDDWKIEFGIELTGLAEFGY